MKWKNGVFTRVTIILKGVETELRPTPEIIKAMNLADITSKAVTGKPITITSLLDGKHKPGSKHYTGNAFDIRTRIYPAEQIAKLIVALKTALGNNYDIVFEGDHIHIEFDPKN